MKIDDYGVVVLTTIYQRPYLDFPYDVREYYDTRYENFSVAYLKDALRDRVLVHGQMLLSQNGRRIGPIFYFAATSSGYWGQESSHVNDCYSQEYIRCKQIIADWIKTIRFKG